MTDGKFTADPARITKAMESMKGIADDLDGWFQQFYDESGNYQKVLKGGQFGEPLAAQIEHAREGFQQARTALTQAFNAVPQGLAEQKRYIQKTQQGMLDSIYQAAQQTEIHPKEPGGHGGKY
jgi:hypothetical protein